MANWYCGSTKWTAVTPWAALTSYNVGDICRQLATPTTGNERVFRCTTAGTSLVAEPTWVVTKGGTTTEAGGPVWTEITGQAAYNGDGGGNAWAAPHARIANALAVGWAAAGDNIYVSNNHAWTQTTALTWPAGSGTVALPIDILCVNDTNIPPTATATTAIESTTGASAITINTTSAYCYGVSLSSGSAASAASIIFSNNDLIFEKGNITLGNTNVASTIALGNATVVTAPSLILKYCNFVFGSTSQGFAGGLFETCRIIGGSVAATGSVPASLFLGTAYANRGWRVDMDGVDLSTITGTIFNGSVITSWTSGFSQISNCILGTGVTVANFGSNFGSYRYDLGVKIYNCDSAATNYRYYYATPLGSVTQETSKVRTGGATDGVTQLSWNLSGSTNLTMQKPFISEPIIQYNSLTTGNHTATIYLTSNAVLTNSNFWIELEYFASGASPVSSFVNSRVTDMLTSGTGLTADSSTWGGTAQTYKYRVTVTFSPAMAGYLKATLYACSGATAIYVDPKIYIDGVPSSSKQYLLPGCGYINETGSSGTSGGSYTFCG